MQVFFGLGSTIGAGVFAIVGIAVQYTGPSLFMSFIIAGVLALQVALMFAELSSRIPIRGSAFTYVYVIVGEFPAWLVGWSQNIRYGLATALLSRALVNYFNGFLVKLGADLPQWMLGYTVFGVEKCSLLAMIAIAILNFIYTRGTGASKMFNMVITVLKLVTLLMIIVIAFIKFDKSNFSPMFLESDTDE